MILTVAIPTYNRNQILRENIQFLLPQLKGRARLIILDNCSDKPVAETLKDILKEFPEVECKIVRHNFIIGAMANILRCFEYCETEWLWILGDSKKVKPDAVETICKHIDSYPDCIFFNFSAPNAVNPARKRVILTKGREEFIYNIDSFGNLILLGASVYRVNALLPVLKFSYHYSYASVHAIASLLAVLGDNKICCFSNEQIVIVGEPLPRSQQWSIVNAALGFSTLLDMPLEPRTRKELAKKIVGTPLEFPSFYGLFLQLLLLAIREKNVEGAIYYFDQICYRRFYFDRRISRRIEILVLRFLLRFPQVSCKLGALAYKLLRGRDLNLESDLQDLTQRL